MPSFQYIRYPSLGGSGNGVAIYPTFASFPVSAPTGTLAVAADSGILYEFIGGMWVAIAAPGDALSIGVPANGLSITANVLSLQLSSSSSIGALSATDWVTFNSKQPVGNYITDLTGDGTASGPGSVPFTLATVATPGTFPKVTFNAKGLVTSGSVLSPSDIPALDYVTSVTASLPLSSSGGFTPNLSITQSNTSTDGYLSSVDWNTFNSKQPAGSYITDLTGQVTASGPGSAAAVIATNTVTNSNLAQMSALSIKGNDSGVNANAADLSVAQVNAILPVFTSTLNGLVPLSGGGTTNFLRADGTWTPAGTGSVTSVALALPASVFTVSGSPVTSSGTLTGDFTTQTPNTFFLGPISGPVAVPTFRSIQNADVQNLTILASVTTIPALALPTTQLTGTIDLTTQVSAVLPVANGGTGDSSFVANSILIGGTTTTSPLQQIPSVSPGFVLTDNGSGLAPTFQPSPGTVSAFFASNQVNTFSGGITSATFVTFDNSPAFTFTPTITGTYKVFSTVPVYNPNSFSAELRVFNTSGGAVLLNESQVVESSNQDSPTILSVYTLTAGITYVFDIQAQVGAGGPISIRGDEATFYMFAELEVSGSILSAPTIQTFLSGSGIYTTPTSPAPLYIKVTIVGGGGSGNGFDGVSGLSNDGTDSTFGTILTAGHGVGGTFNVAPPSGGTNTITGGTTLINVSGGGGSPGGNVTGGAAGNGGNSALGGSGSGSFASTANAGGAAGVNTGSGGGGGSTAGANFASQGGSAAGYIESLISSPSSTYAYVVGSGGASVNGSGAGGSGMILVEEFY